MVRCITYANMRNKNIKQNEFVSNIVFWILFLLICGESSNWNYPAYENHYISYKTYYEDFNHELLYVYFVRLFNEIGLDFKYLFLFLFGTGLLLMRNVVNRYIGQYGWIFYTLFFIFPTCNAVAEFRNSIAMFILTFGFPYLISGKKTDILKFILLIFISFSFHQTSIIYIILLLIFLYDRPKWRFILTIVYFLGLLLCFYLLFFSSALESVKILFATYMEESDIDGLTNRIGYIENTANWGFIIFGSFHLFITYTVYRLRKLYRQNIIVDDVKDRFASLVIFADLLFVFVIVLIKVDSTFYRLLQNLILLNYIAILMMYKNINGALNRNIGRRVYFCFFIILLLFALFRGSSYFEYNILPMFLDNWILGLNF